MRSFVSLGSLLLTLALAACGGGAPSAASTAPAAAPTANADDPSCPVAIPGTSVDVEDTSTGAALVFVTTGDVEDLRRRVASMAQMHNDEHGKMGPLPTGEETGGGHEGHEMGGHAGHGTSGGGEHAGHAGGMISVHSKATIENVEGGAKIVYIAAGADVGKLQSELRMHAQHLASGACSMGSH